MCLESNVDQDGGLREMMAPRKRLTDIRTPVLNKMVLRLGPLSVCLLLDMAPMRAINKHPLETQKIGSSIVVVCVTRILAESQSVTV